MPPVFQEILQMATAKLKEALSQEQAPQWDADSFEQQVREFTHQLGQQLVQVWAEQRVEQAHAQAARCPCGIRRRVHKRKQLWWLTTFGKVQVAEPYLVCPKGHGRDRPFQRLTGVRCRDKSWALKRVLTDFGAQKSFACAALQLREHYGVELHPSSVRQVVEAQAQKALDFVAKKHTQAVRAYQRRREPLLGQPVLIVQSDGSMVRTGMLELCPTGGKTPKRGLARRQRRTQWREVRLTTLEQVGGPDRLYGAVMGSPAQVGEQMFALALLKGWGEGTWVHGVGDGAPWIAQQMAEVFPRHSYLLDRYHLLEHLYAGASGLPQGADMGQWVQSQLAAIDAGDVGKVVLECHAIAGQAAGHPLKGLGRYLENQQGHLDYASARAQGLPIGSGVVEGGHRVVIQARLKLPGAWWSEQMVDPMLALRTLRANGWWDAFWN